MSAPCRQLDAFSLIKRGRSLHRAGELDEALGCYRDSLKRDAEQADAWHLMAVAFHQKGESARSLPYLEKALTVESGKRYEVFASWVADGTSGSTGARYRLYDGTASGEADLTKVVDQQVAPGGHVVAGDRFRSLGRMTASGTTLTVTLDHDTGATGSLCADAIRLVEIQTQSTSTYDSAGNLILSTDALGNATEYESDLNGRQIKSHGPYPDLSAAETVDDQSSDGNGFAKTGTWTEVTGSGEGDDYRYATGDTNTATWTFSNLEKGTPYEVLVSYVADETNHTDAAPFEVFDGTTSGTSLGTGNVDQSSEPHGNAVLGAQWHSLGNVTLSSNTTLTVELTGTTDGKRVVADAVQVLPARATTETVYDDAGRRTKTIDPLGNETVYTYDASDRVIETTLPDPDGSGTGYSSPVTKTYYDATGRTRGQEDALGHATSQVFDDAGRAVKDLYYTDVTGTTVDDASATGFATTGSWTSDTTTGIGYGDSHKRIAADGDDATTADARWTFSGLSDGTDYELLASWVPYLTTNSSGEVTARSAFDATYEVYKTSVLTGNLLQETTVDQNYRPLGDHVLGVGWQSLGTFSLESGESTLIVRLSDDATEAPSSDPTRYVLADAVRLLEPETRTNPRSPHENGDCESLHGHLKDMIDQALMQIRRVDHRRHRLCPTESRRDGSAVHAAG